MKNWYLSH